MKKMSLKLKLTLLHTVLMIGVAWGVLALLVNLGKRDIVAGVRVNLEDGVYNAREYIRYDKGKLKFKSDLMNMEHGVFLSIYSSDGTLLYGKIPYDFDNRAVFKDGYLRKVKGEEEEYYLLDSVIQVPEYGVAAVRGIASLTRAKKEYNNIFHLALVVLPLLVLLTGAISYFFTVWTLKPVKHITSTVRSIRKDGDLSRRVALGKGNDEIYHMAETFDLMLSELENSFQRERQFTSDVSHELRTPISSMMLQCEELLEIKDLDEPVKNGVEVLYDKVKHMSVLISQLLMLSRADSGRAVVEMEKLDFGELAYMAAEEVMEKAEKKNITITSEICSDAFMQGDETLLIRFWMNLLNNSICYGKENGHVHIGVWKEQNKICGRVEDDGQGISRESLPKIWERFYQEDPSRSDPDSLGLGLSMVKWIVSVHGGFIEAESIEKQGTRFSFCFPSGVSDTSDILKMGKNRKTG